MKNLLNRTFFLAAAALGAGAVLWAASPPVVTLINPPWSGNPSLPHDGYNQVLPLQATVVDPNGAAITRVEFFGQNQDLGSGINNGGGTYMLNFPLATFFTPGPFPSGETLYNFYAVATDALGQTAQSGSGSIVVDYPPALVLPQNLPSGTVNQPYRAPIVFTNSYVSVAYAASGLPPGLSINPTTGYVTGTPTQGGTYNVLFTGTNNAGTGSGAWPIVIQSTTTPPTNLPPIVNQPPIIIQQPSSQSVSIGQTVAFSVIANGVAPFSYQWFKNGTAINGATAAGYVTPPAILADNGARFTVVINDATNLPVTSNFATLTVSAPPVVNQPPVITQEPLNQSVNVGQTAAFSVIAGGTPPLSYQWLKNGSPINGANAGSYTTPPATLADSRAQFTVTVNNSVNLPATSNAATLTVNSLPTVAAPTITPDGGTFTDSVQVMLIAAPGAQIRYTTDGSAPTANSSPYSTPLTLIANTVLRAMAFETGMNNSVEVAADFVINQNQRPAITQQPVSQNVNVGQTAIFSVNAGGTPPLSYQWFKNGAVIGGATNASYTTPATMPADNGSQFTVAVDNVTNLPVTSSPATLTVNLPPAAANLSIGSFTTSPGGRIQVPVQFQAGATGISTLIFNLTLPPGISDVFAAAPAAVAASESVQTDLIGTTFSVIVSGINPALIATGDVVDISLHLTFSASGVLPLHLWNQSAADPAADNVPLSTTDGSITVTGADSLAEPLLQVAAVLPVDGSIAIAYSGATPVTFQWTLTPESAAAAAAFAGPAIAAPTRSGPFAASGKVIALAPLDLSPGRYRIQVVAVDSLGDQSPPATADVTLVAATAADLSAVKVYPNPWRADRPTDGIHFENLSADSTVKIFTISGRWVRTLAAANGAALWDLNNDDGNRAASGLYVYLITDDQGEKIHGELGVVK